MKNLILGILLLGVLGAGNLYVDVYPKDSRVRIMNIKPKFYQGIWLNSGYYDIFVTKKGFYPFRKWIKVGYQTKRLNIELKSKNASKFKILPKEAILKLDTGGHSALIRDILVTKSGDIISAGDDKTIRVWDSKTGKEKRKILGEIGEGSEGVIYAIALSPDERFLAVGGYLAGTRESLKRYEIRIYNFKSGKLIKTLKSHTNVVNDLAFSPDGTYLLSGSGDFTAKLWKTADWRLERTLSFHSNDVYGVGFIDGKIVTVGYDNRIFLSKLDGTKLGEYNHSHKLAYVATSKNYIATCGKGNQILIFDRDLKLLKKIDSETEPKGLKFSLNGKYLIAGAGAYPMNTNIYQTSNFQKLTSFKKHTNLTMAVNFLDNQTAISGGGNNNEIYIWDIFSGRVKTEIIGKGRRVWSVGQKGDWIGWGNVFDAIGDYHTNRSTIQKAINLSTFQIENSSSSENWKKIPTTYKNYSLSHSAGGDYGYSDAVLNIKKNGEVIAKIVRGSTDGYQHRTYGFWRDKIVSGGNNGKLAIYDLNGNQIANLVGHTGTIWSISIQGDRLVSGSSDQTIRIWDLGKLKSKIKPQLSLFISSDNEWVAWTPENFFTSSKNGKDLIGFHINQGPNHEAQFLAIDKFYNSFYRPDLIAKAINGESLEKYAKNIDIQKLIDGGLPPKIRIANYFQENGILSLKIEVCENDGGVGDLKVLLNGSPIDILDSRGLRLVRKERDNCYFVNRKIQLTDGVNRVSTFATNQKGTIESNRDEISLRYSAPQIEKPNLHIFAIGVSDYYDSSLNLRYSVADAKAILKTVPEVSKKLFKHIYTYKLFNSEVTKENIRAKFSEIAKKISPKDVFIFYIAGHGVTDDLNGQYYFIPYDFIYRNEDSIRETAISSSFLADEFAKIKTTKSLSLFDTCNSGAVAINRGGLAMKTAIAKLNRATGRATITASSKEQVAMEGYKGHGVFTFAVLEALKGRGYGNDNKITIKELSAYVEDRVPEITDKIWRERQLPQADMQGNDFPIGVK